jgi:hypothetical protein
MKVDYRKGYFYLYGKTLFLFLKKENKKFWFLTDNGTVCYWGYFPFSEDVRINFVGKS